MPARLADIPAALSLLTRLPMPRAEVARGAAAAWAWPLAGLVVGGLAAVALALGVAAGLPTAPVAGLSLAAGALVTGAMHEDGLADTADGLWGGWTRERRLEIMRDSRIGTYGVMALILVTGLRWAALAHLVAAGAGVASVLAVGAISRAAMAPIARLPPARTDGLSRRTGRPAPATCLAALALAGIAATLLLGGPGLAAGAAGFVAALGIGFVAHAKIGGQTGDILGAAQQIAELAALAVLAAAIV